jgi:adenylate cyclase
MIEKLENSPAAAIGYDVTFSEAGPGDERFIEVLFNSDKLVFPMEGTVQLKKNKLPEFTKTLWPIEPIKQKFSIGHSVLIPDNDGKIRKMPFFIKNNSKKTAPFFMKALERAGWWKDSAESNPYVYDFDEFGLFKIKYYGPKRTFYHYSFGDVLKKDFDSNVFENKIVLVGATAPNLHDEYFTPTSRGLAVPGVEIQANLIESYVQNDFLRQINNKTDYLIHLILLGIFAGICAFSVKMRYSLILFFVICVLYLIFTAALFSFGYILPILYPILLIIVIFVFSVLVKYLLEEKEKNKIKAGFSQYVAKEVVDEIMKNPKKLNLGGAEKKITILFSDIRSFTSLSERLGPKKLVALLNEYLSEMADLIIDNEGVIDKFIGDAIMSFWGAPLDNKKQEICAVRAALLMTEKLKNFNKKNKNENQPEISVGIGINTGRAIVGNIGSKKRFDYTAVGDDVNLASRLEGLTKFYKVSIIVSESTAKAAQNEFVFRYLDQVAVKGKNEGVKIYQAMGVRSRSKKSEKFAIEFQRAVNFYLNENFERAKRIFEKLKEKHPNDKPISLYLERIEYYTANPNEKFDKIFKADFK